MTDAQIDLSSPLVERYYALRGFLGIVLIDLDRMYMETPRVLQDAGELAAEADNNEMTARHTYDVIKAEACDRIRRVMVAGKEPSEARIDKLVPLELDVQKARAVWETSRYEAAVCTTLYRSLEAQSRLLGKASDMVLGGFISPSAAYDQRRREMNQIRSARADEKERPIIGRPVD